MKRMRDLVRDSFLSVYGKMDPHKRRNAFEVFGYDFMVDEKFKVYLIEVNTNPCLETPCSLLSSIIFSMLDHAFRIALDPFYKPADSKVRKKGNENMNALSKYTMVFDERSEGKRVKEMYKSANVPLLDEEDKMEEEDFEENEEELKDIAEWESPIWK